MYKVKVDSKKFTDFLSDFPKHFEDTFMENASRATDTIHSEMQTVAPTRSQNEKVNWDSIKQMKAFFATDGFGGGIPHTRQGNYPNFQKVSLPDGFAISAKSPAGAIGGTIQASGSTIDSLDQLTSWQSKIHRGRWKPLLPVVKKAINQFIKNFKSALTGKSL